MSYLDVASGAVVADLPGEHKAAFIRRTYGHLALAIVAFAFVESQLLKLGFGEQMMAMLATTRWSWLIVLGAFMLVGTVADKWARSGASRELQYAGLALYIVAEAVLFLPIIYLAQMKTGAVIQNAAIVTAGLVAGLTMVVFITRSDFSFLKPALAVGGLVAMGIIFAAIAFGFNLGMFFYSAMVIFAAGSILYTTSNILHVYHEDQHVAASLALFASVALMFWYVLQIFMNFGDD